MVMLKEILNYDQLVIASKIFKYKLSWYLGFVSNTPAKGGGAEGSW